MTCGVAILYSRAAVGLDAPLVTVEADITGGLPAFSIVGLPETAVKESKDRVRSAILNSQFSFPSRRITVNLAPADLPKEGTRFDLPIALGILGGSNQLAGAMFERFEFVGELALSGGLRLVHGILPLIRKAQTAGRTLIIPKANADEAALCGYDNIFLAEHLLEVCSHLLGQQKLPRIELCVPEKHSQVSSNDLLEVEGQLFAKRGLEVCAAGGHNLLFFGAPGTGKTLLASRLPSILPPLSDEEAVEVLSIQSISHQSFDLSNWYQRPFRAPHHTASAVALVGGGSKPKPGEISLAHRGVLFLDELPEFDRRVLEVLREPMESGVIRISRAAQHIEFPARFQLVASMNPCPCGYLGDKQRACRCSPDQTARYRRKVSGPLLDRFDLHIEVARSTMRGQSTEDSATVQRRVVCARERQLSRCGFLNAHLSLTDLKATCQISDADEKLLETAINKLGLSKRAHHRILKVARTIADLADCASIQTQHLTEALGFRQFDRISESL